MTRLTPSVLLTPDPEGSLFDADEVNKRVDDELNKACLRVAKLLGEMGGIRPLYSQLENAIRSRNEESK